MALSTIQKITRLNTDSDTLHGVIHGPARGPGSRVPTEGGDVITVAAAIANVQDAGNVAIGEMQALANAQGYQVPVAYAAGINMSTANQTVEYGGQVYAPIAAMLPFVTSGTFEADKFRLIQGLTQGDLGGGSGASLVGYTSPENPTINIHVKRALDDSVDLRTKFGLSGDENADQTNAWNDLVEYVNSLPSGGGSVRLDGCYRITGAHQTLTSSLALNGTGAARSRLLFDGVDGLKIDFSKYVQQKIGALIRDLAITTNGTQYTGISVKPPTGNADDLRLTMERVFLCSELRWKGVPQNTQPDEWAVGIELGDINSNYKLSNTNLDNVYIYGSYLNANYGTLTGSVGVRANGVTGLRMDRPNIWLLGDALVMRGQTEGLIIQGGTLVTVKRGIVFTSCKDPSNNHVVSGTHINPYTRGIVMEDAGISTTQFLACKYSNMFILEASSTVTKSEGFVGVEAYCSNSELSNVTVWANAPVSSSSTEKIAFRLGNNGNGLANCNSHNMGYQFDIRPYSTGKGSGSVRTTDCYETGSGTQLLYPGSLYPVGTVRGSLLGEGVDTKYADASFAQSYTDGLQWLTERPYRRTNLYTKNTSYYWDIKSSTGAAAFDGRMLLTGGDATANGRAAWVLYGASFKFAADSIGPNADNSTSAGTPSSRYSVMYAGTGSINISDARFKTGVTSLSDAEIACAQELAREIGWYKWLASVAEKGDAARKHFGMTVQRCIEIFAVHGLDAVEYGAVCYDKWDASDAVQIETDSGEPEIVTPARAAGDLYSFRHDELLAFIVRGLAASVDAMQGALNVISTRVQALEASSGSTSST